MTHRRSVLSLLALIGAAAMVVALFPSRADACQIVPSPAFVLDEEASVSGEPGAPEIGVPSITRAVALTSPMRCELTSCDDITWISVPITPPEGYEVEEVGYVIERVGGVAPTGFRVPEEPVYGRGVSLSFGEDVKKYETLDVELSVRAIDRAGNLGPAVTFQLVDTDSVGGCGASTGRATSLALPLLLILALRARRMSPVTVRSRNR